MDLSKFISNKKTLSVHLESAYLYIYKTEAFEASTNFHVSTMLKKIIKQKNKKNKTKKNKKNKQAPPC